MIHSLTRILVLVAASFTFAAPALAGFNYPFNEDACNAIINASESLNDTNIFVVYDKCDDLCKAAAKFCETLVKDAASCHLARIKHHAAIGKKECEDFVSTDRTECRNAAKAQADGAKNALEPDKAEAIFLCKQWGLACADQCVN